MRAILVDSEHKLLRDVELDGQLETIYALLSSSYRKVEVFQATEVRDDLFAFVDEEALLQRPLPKDWLWLKGSPHPLAGNAILVGAPDGSGGNTPPAITVLQAAAMVKFLDVQTVCFMFARH